MFSLQAQKLCLPFWPALGLSSFKQGAQAGAQLSWEAGAVCLWHPRVQLYALLLSSSIAPFLLGTNRSCFPFVPSIPFPLPPPPISLGGKEERGERTGVMSLGLRVATRQHHREAKRSRAEMVLGLCGGPRSARKMRISSFSSGSFIYTYVYILCAYICPGRCILVGILERIS